MTIEIRQVPAADLRAWFDAVNLAFAEHSDEAQWALDRRILEPERVLGAYDGERMVGGAAAFSFQVTVPGGREVPTAGVTMVGVQPSHRRQGILRRLMERQLADVRARGEPLAALWASEASIYQRFGYGIGALNGRLDLERDRAAFVNPVEATGSVRLVEPEAARPMIQSIYDAVRARTPGFYRRSDAWWEVWLADPEHRRRGLSRKFHALHVRAEEPVGYVVYRVKEDWRETGPASTLMVQELLAVDAEATRQLWRYVTGVDLMARIHARFGPADHPLLLLVAEPRRLSLRVADGLWLRIVDIPAALEARGYAADGALVLDIEDRFMPDRGGRWRVSVTNGHAEVEPTTDSADLQLNVNDLAAAYLGAFTFGSLGRAGRTVELSERARARADMMFASAVPPWCPEVF